MAKRIPAGDLRHVVSIQDNTAEGTYGTYGEVASTSTSWGTLKSLRAKIEQLSGNEATIARQIYPTVTHRVTIDYCSTLGSTGATRRRVQFGSRNFNIFAVMNVDEENVQMELLCSEDR